MKAIMNSIKVSKIFTIIKNSYSFKMEFIRENKTCKDQEKVKANVSGVMALIMRDLGRMDREMGQGCSFKDKVSSIKVNGKTIRSMVEVL